MHLLCLSQVYELFLHLVRITKVLYVSHRKSQILYHHRRSIPIEELWVIYLELVASRWANPKQTVLCRFRRQSTLSICHLERKTTFSNHIDVLQAISMAYLFQMDLKVPVEKNIQKILELRKLFSFLFVFLLINPIWWFLDFCKILLQWRVAIHLVRNILLLYFFYLVRIWIFFMNLTQYCTKPLCSQQHEKHLPK